MSLIMEYINKGIDIREDNILPSGQISEFGKKMLNELSYDMSQETGLTIQYCYELLTKSER
jgi:hypothetical protein